MTSPLSPDSPPLREGLYRLYREFFDHAERKRRWSLADDIPWGQVNRRMDPAVADVVESFCAVELYLPDYVARALPMFRANRGWAFFHTNWGYEESKHSLALSDWLLRSGLRTEEQMADLEGRVFAFEWQVPHGNPVGMLAYAMVQELATGLSYRNLRQQLAGGSGDPALCKLLGLLGVDEQAHHGFFLKAVGLFLRHDRGGTLRQLRGVLHNFAMPAIYELADGRRRVEAIKALRVFDDRMYFDQVYGPVLAALGVSRQELRKAA